MEHSGTSGGALVDAEAQPRAERAAMQRQRLTMLVGADLHGSREGLAWFCAQATALKPDLLVFLGDFANDGPVSRIREVLREWRDLAPHCFVVPGNWDPREALHCLDVEAYDGLRHLHKSSAALAGYVFSGLGGSLPTLIGTTPLEMPEDSLVPPFAAHLPADVWLLHNPLRGFRDRIASGAHVGSEQLLGLLSEQEPPPLLVLSGHIHEAHGAESNGATTFVNPGSLQERRAAWITLDAGQINTEMLEG